MGVVIGILRWDCRELFIGNAARIFSYHRLDYEWIRINFNKLMPLNDEIQDKLAKGTLQLKVYGMDNSVDEQRLSIYVLL